VAKGTSAAHARNPRLASPVHADQTLGVRRIGGAIVVVMAALTPAFLLASPTEATNPPTIPTPTLASPSAGIVYPLTSFIDWAENPLDNVTDPSLGENSFEQILDNAQAATLRTVPALATMLAPSNLLGPNGPADLEAYGEEMAANLIHLRPEVAGDDVLEEANPDFLPDFDHNGVYGDPGDYSAFYAGNSGTGYFLYPCITDSGAVLYETTQGTCAAAGTPGDTYKRGVAQQLTIVNSRGLALAATLWLPAAALSPGCTDTDNPDPTACTAPSGLAPRAALDGGRGLPTVVMSDGIASAQPEYFWIAMSLARAGDIVLTYDPAGQGASEGSVADLFTPAVPNCEFGGACRDLQDVMRWLVDDPITPVVDLNSTNPIVSSTNSGEPARTANRASAAAAPSASPGISNPAYEPSGDNIVDPALAAIDTSKLAVVGHSMGALSLLNYLWYQGHGDTGADGKPLPPLATGIALSGAQTTTATVPIQFQTSDYDGSPLLVGPTVGGVDLGTAGNGIGYADMKPLYDQLRTEGPGTSTLEMVVLEGGVHTDFIDTPFIPRTPWSLAVSAHYATAWMGCFLDDQFLSCLNAVIPVAHLSSSFASEAAPSIGPLPHASRCITVPTTASLNDSPSQLLSAEEGHPVYTCTP
jgi:pimeloyl-ACP methyl ester carboxylesterase